MRKINEDGINLIKEFEGCKLTSYQDQGGVWTIGYGHTGPEIVEGTTITQQQADMYLRKDVDNLSNLDYYISVSLSDNEYSALLCLAYNIGAYALRISKCLKDINDNKDPTDNWMKWNHIHGVVNEGLTRRRKAEIGMYFGRYI